MSVSVVGFDLGSLTSYVVVARQGGLESVANEYSDRNTPTCVSFGDKMRFIGHEAKQQQISNVKNTICCFNRFVGKTFQDKMVSVEAERQLCKVVEAEDQRVGFEVSYLGEKQVFSAEQVYAMQLTKLKEVAEMNLQSKVIDVVINVPTNATDSERRAIFDAAKIANLNCIRIINDTTSSALAYGFYKQDLPETTDKSRIVAFVDMGYSNLQSALVAFNKGKMRVIASSCDTIGGRDLDQAIYNHVKADFKERYKLVVEDDKKPGVRLMQECEKLKKLMSANSTAIPMNIECFMNDVDVSTKMKRSEFEELSSDVLLRVRSTLERLLVEGNLTADQVDSVEIIGGSTRVSAVKDIITEVFKQEVRTSLNSDEAVAKGCTVQCAILSPALRAKEFTITDTCPYPINLCYEDVNGNEIVEVYHKWHQFPASKQMTFNRNASFKLEARYAACSELPISNTSIGLFNVTGLNVGDNGEMAKVKVKLRVNANGIFTCCQAQQLENVEKEVEVDAEPVEKMETSNGPVNGDVAKSTDSAGEGEKTPVVAAVAPAKVKKMVTKTVTRSVDLPMQAMLLQYMPARINEYNERENQMVMQVKLEKEKAHSKNAVEEYVYEMRDKLYGELEGFVSEEERDRLCEALSAAETWIYEEEEVGKQAYVERLACLRAASEGAVRRWREAQERPLAAEEHARACVAVQRALAGIEAGEETHAHLSGEERQTLSAALEEAQSWMGPVLAGLRNLPGHCDSPVTAADIRASKDALVAKTHPILSRPRPTVVPPPTAPATEERPGNGPADPVAPADDCAKTGKAEDMDLD